MPTDETALDDPERIEAADPSAVLRAIASSGAQVRTAMTLADEARLDRLVPDGRPRAVVVVADGPEAPVGEVVTAVVSGHSGIPVIAVPGDALPGWIGFLDLAVVCASETRAHLVATVAELGRRGCRTLVITPAGTPLAAAAEQNNALHVAVDLGGRPPATTAWLFVTLALRAVVACGVLSDAELSLAGTADVLDEIAIRCRPSQDPFVNPAKDLALALADRLLLSWGTGSLAAVAARRLAWRMAADAGCPALAGSPREILGYQLALLDGPFGESKAADIFHDPELDSGAPARLHVVLLHDEAVSTDGAPEQLRPDVLTAMLDDRHIRYSELRPDGVAPLERIASLMCVADFAAAYLAMVVGRDPAGGLTRQEYQRRTSS